MKECIKCGTKECLLINAEGYCFSCAHNEKEQESLKAYNPERLSDEVLKLNIIRINNSARGKHRSENWDIFFRTLSKLRNEIFDGNKDSEEYEETKSQFALNNIVLYQQIQIEFLVLNMKELMERLKEKE